MFRILRTNVYAKLYVDDRKEELSLASDILSVDVPNAWRSPKYKKRLWDGKKRFLHRPANVFLSGLTELLCGKLTELGKVWTVEDKRAYHEPDGEPISDTMLNGVTLIPEQLECIRGIVEKKRGIIDAAVNSGKTEIFAASAKTIGGRSLFLTHSLLIMDQTIKRLELRLGKKIGIIHAGQFEPEEITVAMVQSLNSMLNNEGLLLYLKTIDYFYCDEVHHLPASQWDALLCEIPCGRRVGGSASPITGDVVRDYILTGHTGEVIGTIEDKFMIESGRSAKPYIFFIKYNYEGFIEDGGYQFVYDMALVHNGTRNDLIVDIAKRLAEANFPCLIFLTRVPHGQILSQKLEELGVTAPFISGSMPLEERVKWCDLFRTGDIKIMIATSVFDEGMDVPQIKSMIIAGAGRGGMGGIRMIQRVGRGKRKKQGAKNTLYVVEIIDNSHRYLVSQIEQRFKVCERKGWHVELVEDPVSKAIEIENAPD